MCRVRDWALKKPPLFLKQGCLVYSDGALCHCRRIFIGMEPGAELIYAHNFLGDEDARIDLFKMV